MNKRIDAEIGVKGEVKLEFTGFDGENCYTEADVLKKALRSMGLQAIPVQSHPKSLSEIEREMGEKSLEKTGKSVPLS